MPGAERKPTILYIDDSAVEREIVRQLLQAEGCEVISTGSPQAGIELACRRLPDLILLDLHMPGTDGCAVADRLREVPELRRIPIVALSSSIREEERAEVYNKFDGFVKKPVDLEAFPAELREFICRGRSGGTPSGDAARDEPGGGEPCGEAREALEALEKIRSAMSHDLRSPLTAMISYASTVSREKAGSLSERQKEMLEVVVEQGFKMDSLISELVRTARETLDRYGYPPHSAKPAS